MENETNNRTGLAASHLEQDTSNAPLGTQETARFNSPVNIHIHSIRKRLCDADGISAKAAIDGLVKAGIIIDDAPVYVRQVSYSQEKCKIERTIITLTTTTE